ncbi:unnamed protein product [Ambrosiozyma monospora]|uniref:Unnamed protein product n=1 Tax=Ambrosiozyma monospora TaxID=43982 RepID=A0ACB5TYU8_AMBMO|nr:unnamed protein product [Ambrosiozyma monospora]
MDKKTNIGTLNCKICGQSFQSPINSLSQPIDIYSDWVDACEAVAEELAKPGAGDYDDDGYEEDDDGRSGHSGRRVVTDDYDD